MSLLMTILSILLFIIVAKFIIGLGVKILSFVFGIIFQGIGMLIGLVVSVIMLPFHLIGGLFR